MQNSIRPRAGLLVLAYLAFISLGLPDGLLGVAWPAIRGDFGVPTAAVGFVLTASTIGYLASSVAAGFLLSRIGVGRLLGASTALAGLALAGYAAAPHLAPMVGLGLLLGLGSGAIDSGLNAYAAGAFGARHMSWLHAFFGLGVALGPLIMTGVLDLGLAWRWGYAVVATAQLGLALAFLVTARAWGRGRGSDAPTGGVSEPPPRIRHTLALPAVWLGVLAFALYVAIEIGTGLWAYLLLTEGRGMAPTAAGLCVSGYWGSLFVGRVVQGVVAERLGTPRVLTASLVGIAVGAALVAVPGPAAVTVVGLAVLGFAAAPVFPLLMLTTAARVGSAHADRAIGLQTAGAALGGALIPSGIGVLLAGGVQRLGPAMLLLSLLLLAVYAVAHRRPAADPATG